MNGSEITPLHVERGMQMREIVRHDVASLGLSFEAAVEILADHLEIQPESVRLGIAIANSARADGRGGWVVSTEHGTAS